MNAPHKSIFVNSCQYTPVYLIQSPGATQANYVLAQTNIEEPKPVSDNLKRFYENSGSIENCVVTKPCSPKPRILKKTENTPVGNNLKLASFLLPKSEPTNKQYVVNNIVVKPNTTVNTNTTNCITVNNVPRLNIDRKVVKLKHMPIKTKNHSEKPPPKTKPKENAPTYVTPVQNASKHTLVQLLKLGETYHSLNKLDDDQMKMVNKALKIFSDPEKIVPKPTHDPIANTKLIYKVVSPKDLTVVGKNKIIVKDKNVKQEIKKEVFECPLSPEPEPPVEEKVTRSGRKVKLPKPIESKSPQKPKKKISTRATCFQCSAEFNSLYRLQKHYENQPTHIPAKIHSNLFHCLLAIVKSGSEGDRTNIFIQQLEQLIVKLKSLLPCLLNTMDGNEGRACTVNDDVARMFGMVPGKYTFNVDALSCVKNKEGFCMHNPPIQINKDASQQWNSNGEINIDTDSKDCARINSVDKWPTVSKRNWKKKQMKTEENAAKRMRLQSENGDTFIELGMEDFTAFNKTITQNNSPPVPTQNGGLLSQLHDSAPTINLLPNHAQPMSPIQNSAQKITLFQNSIPQMAQVHNSPITLLQNSAISQLQNGTPTINLLQNNAISLLQNSVPNITSFDNSTPTVTPINNSAPISTLIHNNTPIMTTTQSNKPITSLQSSLIHFQQSSVPIVIQKEAGDKCETIENEVSDKTEINIDHNKLSKGPHTQFHSTHFDIRSSPIKSTSTVFSKFQIVPERLPKYEAQMIQPLIGDKNNEQDFIVNSDSLQDIFRDHIDLACKDTNVNESSNDLNLKDWILNDNKIGNHTKNDLIEQTSLHKSNIDNIMNVNDNSNDSRLLSIQGDSVLNFFESLGNDLVSETEIRNNAVDFHLDLFSFNNS